MDFLEIALNFIYPKTCGICGKIGEGYLCSKCKNELINSEMYLNKFDEHFYIFSYEKIIREIILKYKFDDKPYLSNTIYEFFINNEKICGFLKKYDIITPVPISSLRKKERGYNQSELIAKKIGHLGIIKFENNILIKIKNNKPQSSLNKNKRIENVKNVYKVRNEAKIIGKNIVLFDDIYTTGATANECKRVLKQAGAKSVGILTIAKDFMI